MLPKNTANNLIIIIIFLLCTLFGFIVVRKNKKIEPTTPNSYAYTTTSGKTIQVEEKDSSTKDKSTVVITTEGFEQNTPITVEKDKLTNVYFSDLNGDSHEEVVLVFASRAEPYKGEALTYTTYYENSLTPVEIPNVEEMDMAPGMLFEGYLGGDIFVVERNTLLRTFLVTPNEEEVDTSLTKQAEEESTENEEISPVEEQEATTTASIQITQTTPSPSRKQIAYSLLFAEGSFYLEPSEIESVKQYTASSTATLSGTQWKWLSFSYEGNPTSSGPNEDVALLFQEDNIFSATSSCDSFSGGYASSEKVLRLGSITTQETREGVTCSSGIEALKNVLPLSESFTIRDNQLMITLEGKKGVILFMRQ